MLFTLTLILLLSLTSATARRSHKRLIIHVPFRIKTHHHTHTVYSHIRSASSGISGGVSTGKGMSSGSSNGGGGTKQTIYKILSFAMQGKGHAGHSGHGGGGGGLVHKSGRGGGRYENDGHGGAHEHNPGDSMYDDYHGGVGDADAGRCSDGGPHGYGDMVFNHFSRSSDESNESDEYPEMEEYVDEDDQRFVWE